MLADTCTRLLLKSPLFIQREAQDSELYRDSSSSPWPYLPHVAVAFHRLSLSLFPQVVFRSFVLVRGEVAVTKFVGRRRWGRSSSYGSSCDWPDGFFQNFGRAFGGSLMIVLAVKSVILSNIYHAKYSRDCYRTYKSRKCSASVPNFPIFSC